MHGGHQLVAFSLYTQDGYSPLHNASQEGRIGVVERLHMAGATVNLQAKVGIDVTLSLALLKTLLNQISQLLAFLREHGPRLPSSFMLGYALVMQIMAYSNTPYVGMTPK